MGTPFQGGSIPPQNLMMFNPSSINPRSSVRRGRYPQRIVGGQQGRSERTSDQNTHHQQPAHHLTHELQLQEDAATMQDPHMMYHNVENFETFPEVHNVQETNIQHNNDQQFEIQNQAEYVNDEYALNTHQHQYTTLNGNTNFSHDGFPCLQQAPTEESTATTALDEAYNVNSYDQNVLTTSNDHHHMMYSAEYDGYTHTQDNVFYTNDSHDANCQQGEPSFEAQTAVNYSEPVPPVQFQPYSVEGSERMVERVDGEYETQSVQERCSSEIVTEEPHSVRDATSTNDLIDQLPSVIPPDLTVFNHQPPDIILDNVSSDTLFSSNRNCPNAAEFTDHGLHIAENEEESVAHESFQRGMNRDVNSLITPLCEDYSTMQPLDIVNLNEPSYDESYDNTTAFTPQDIIAEVPEGFDTTTTTIPVDGVSTDKSPLEQIHHDFEALSMAPQPVEGNATEQQVLNELQHQSMAHTSHIQSNGIPTNKSPLDLIRDEPVVTSIAPPTSIEKPLEQVYNGPEAQFNSIGHASHIKSNGIPTDKTLLEGKVHNEPEDQRINVRSSVSATEEVAFNSNRADSGNHGSIERKDVQRSKNKDKEQRDSGRKIGSNNVDKKQHRRRKRSRTPRKHKRRHRKSSSSSSESTSTSTSLDSSTTSSSTDSSEDDSRESRRRKKYKKKKSSKHHQRQTKHGKRRSDKDEITSNREMRRQKPMQTRTESISSSVQQQHRQLFDQGGQISDVSTTAAPMMPYSRRSSRPQSRLDTSSTYGAMQQLSSKPSATNAFVMPDKRTIEAFAKHWNFYLKRVDKFYELQTSDPLHFSSMTSYYTMLSKYLNLKAMPTLENFMYEQKMKKVRKAELNTSVASTTVNTTFNDEEAPSFINGDVDYMNNIYQPTIVEENTVTSHGVRVSSEVSGPVFKFSTAHAHAVINSASGSAHLNQLTVLRQVGQTRRRKLDLNVYFSKLEGGSSNDMFHKFPGPLSLETTHKGQLVAFCKSKIDSAKNHAHSVLVEADRSSYILVWKLLMLMIRQKNVIEGSDLAELLLEDVGGECNIPPPEDSMSIASNESSKTSSSKVSQHKIKSLDRLTEPQMIDKFRHYLLIGDQNKALEYAVTHKLWGHALFLASKMKGGSGNTYTSVLIKFANDLDDNDSLQTLYQLMSGSQPRAVTGDCFGGGKRSGSLWSPHSWRPHLAMILSNLSSYPSEELCRTSILNLASTLKSHGLLWAHSFCMLVSGLPDFTFFSRESLKSFHSLMLIGMDNEDVILDNAFDGDVEIFECIQCTEVYEYICKMSESDFFMPSMFFFKFRYIVKLLDLGSGSKALEYVKTLCGQLVKVNYLGSVTSDQSTTLLEMLNCLLNFAHALKTLESGWITSTGGGSYYEEPEWITAFEYYVNSVPVDDSGVTSNNNVMMNAINDYNESYGVRGDGGVESVDQIDVVPDLPVIQQEPNQVLSNVIPNYSSLQSTIDQYDPSPINLPPTINIPNERQDTGDSVSFHPNEISSGNIVNSDSNFSNKEREGEETTYGANYHHQQYNIPNSSTFASTEINNNHSKNFAQMQPPMPIPIHDTKSPMPTVPVLMPSPSSSKEEVSTPPSGSPPKSEAVKNGSGGGSGFLNRLWSKIVPQQPNQMHLPDDSQAEIVWSEKYKKWVNVNATEEELEKMMTEKRRPPPSDLQINKTFSSAPSSNAGGYTPLSSSAATTPLAPLHSGGTALPPTGNKFAGGIARKGRGRSGRVDVFKGQGGGSTPNTPACSTLSTPGGAPPASTPAMNHPGTPSLSSLQPIMESSPNIPAQSQAPPPEVSGVPFFNPSSMKSGGPSGSGLNSTARNRMTSRVVQ